MEIALLFRLSHVQVKLFSRILTDPTALMVSSPPFYDIIFSYLFSNNYLNRLDATPILGLTQKPKLGLRQITNHLTLLFFRTKIPSTRIFYFSFPFLLLVAGHWTRVQAARAPDEARSEGCSKIFHFYDILQLYESEFLSA